MKLIRSYSTEAEAYIDKGMLESNGIDCVVEVDAMSSVFPAPDSGNGSVNLYVKDSDYDAALKLLDDHSDY